MHAPVVAQALRERGHDVRAVADYPELRALTDEELFAWAADQRRRLATENVKDYRRLAACSGVRAGDRRSTLHQQPHLNGNVRRRTAFRGGQGGGL
jgi:nucleoside-diphosphate-sugar epimerase